MLLFPWSLQYSPHCPMCSAIKKTQRNISHNIHNIWNTSSLTMEAADGHAGCRKTEEIEKLSCFGQLVKFIEWRMSIETFVLGMFWISIRLKTPGLI